VQSVFEQKGPAYPGEHAQHAADQAHHDGFTEKLHLNVLLRGADRQPYADFPGALSDGDQLNIHDSNSSHQQREGSGAGQQEGKHIG